jgi:hypothetical protein
LMLCGISADDVAHEQSLKKEDVTVLTRFMNND